MFQNRGMDMNKKVLIVILVAILILISVFACVIFWPKEEINNVSQGSLQGNEEPESKYVMEENNEKYSARILEAENKDFATLYIETNITESGDKISVSYNNEKFLLNTANPDLEDIEIIRKEKVSTFDLEVETLKNYGIIFIKKNPKSIVVKEDIVIK